MRLQREKFNQTWNLAISINPSLRKPAIGFTEEGILQVSWSFTDTPGRVFTLDIDQDGLIDWFYLDVDKGIIAGTEDTPDKTLSDYALQFLVENFNGGVYG